MLQSNLNTLEHSTITLKTLFRSITDDLPQPNTKNTTPKNYDEKLRSTFTILITNLTNYIQTFDALIQTEANKQKTKTKTALRAALQTLHKTKIHITKLLLINTTNNPKL